MNPFEIKNVTLFQKKNDVVKTCCIKIFTENNKYVLSTTDGILGEKEKIKETSYDSYDECVKKYDEKYNEKIQKKYCLDLSDCDTINSEEEEGLDYETSFLVNLISKEEILISVLKNIGIDYKLMPIEKINAKRINGAFEILHKLQTNNYKQSDGEYIDLVETYYKYIPLVSNIPITSNIIDKYISDLHVIKNIYNTYTSIIKNKNIPFYKRSYFVFKSLDIGISVLDQDEEFNDIIKLINNDFISKKIKLIYKINNPRQKTIYDKTTQNIKDKRLLFHGSPVTNWFSILKNGFYIDSTKAGVRINGKAYGNGLYFSDRSEYSHNYCMLNNNYYSDFLLLGVCEVALCEKSYKQSPIFVIFNTDQYDFKYLICISAK